MVVLNFFDYNDPKIPVEGVASTSKMLVNLYGVWTLYIISMLVDSPVTLLAFQFSYVLFALTLITPGDVNSIFATAVGFLPDGEAFSASSVVEDVGVYDMGAAFGVSSASTGGASSSCQFRSDDFAIS